MANSSLRELAKEHAQGNLDKDAYRKSRAELIQGIVNSTIPLKQIEYPPLVQPPEPEPLDDTLRKVDVNKTSIQKAAPESASSTRPGARKSSSDSELTGTVGSSKLPVIGIVVALVVIIFVAVFVLKGDGNSGKTNTSTTTKSEVRETSVKTPAQKLIQGFLKDKNWSSSSLDTFRQQWSELPLIDVQANKESVEMGQLTNAIYKQLLEEQALSGLVDDDSSLDKQEQLVQFASELGIEDARISLPEQAEVMENVLEDIEP
ncbi:MAG: hypothetical protein ACI9SC_002212 [Gammaproteobacteria bacterium]|jgi:hypothetical protein